MNIFFKKYPQLRKYLWNKVKYGKHLTNKDVATLFEFFDHNERLDPVGLLFHHAYVGRVNELLKPYNIKLFIGSNGLELFNLNPITNEQSKAMD